MKKIELTKGAFAKVDDRDFVALNRYSWYCLVSEWGNYAARRVSRAEGGHTVLMHNVIMGAAPGTVDHRNHDGLDNRRRNLRVCAEHENYRNRRKPKGGQSKYKGVSPRGDGKKWVATIHLNYKKTHLGSFIDEREAALAYDRAALRLHGEFAATNKSLGLL